MVGNAERNNKEDLTVDLLSDLLPVNWVYAEDRDIQRFSALVT
jgi:hypothetical protein